MVRLNESKMLQRLLFMCALLAARASTACDRAMLQNATDAYTSAQANGRPYDLIPLLASNLNYTENETPTNITTGVLNQPLKLDHNRSIHDTTICGTFTELIATNNPHPYVIGTRMIFTDNKITLIESIVTDQGDWAFNSTGYLYWQSFEKWDPIPAEKRDSRAVIQAAGDAYFDRFGNESVTVPFSTPCARLEGGAYTARTPNNTENTCSLGLPSTIHVTNRRYIIDEEMGVVDIFLGFPGLDRSQGDAPMPDSHVFRVEGGKIR